MVDGQLSASVLRCLGLFARLLAPEAWAADSTLQRSIFAALGDERTRFKVWSGNIGAHKTGRSSLEYRLRDASHIEKQVLRLLDDLTALIEDALAIAAGEKTPWDQLEDDGDPFDESNGEEQDDGVPETELGQIATDLTDVVNCLLRLSVAIRNPAPHDRFIASAPTDTSHYEAFDTQHVQSKFSTINDALAERLGKAISRRRQYFKYRAHHHEKLRHGLELDADLPKDTATTVASSIPNHQKDLGADVLMDEDTPSDAGISQTSFASSVAEDDRLRVPPLPKEAQKGPFECPFCFMMIAVTNSISWKRHVFGDLRPYVCLSEDCPAQKEFSRRHDWLEHEAQNHWKTYRCPSNCVLTFASAAECKSHLQKAHPNSVSSGQLDAIVSLSARPLKPEDGIACPLCREVLSSRKGYQRHVGRHQEQLALFALPSLETEGEIASDDEDDGSELAGDDISESEKDVAEAAAASLAGDSPSESEKATADLLAESRRGGPLDQERPSEEHHSGSAATVNVFIPKEGEDMDGPGSYRWPLVERLGSSDDNAESRKIVDIKSGEQLETESTLLTPEGEKERLDIAARDRAAQAEFIKRRAATLQDDIESARRLQEDRINAGVDEAPAILVSDAGQLNDGRGEKEKKDQPIYTRMSRRHLSIETLRIFGLDFDVDEDPDYLVIKRWVPEEEQDELWRHTAAIRREREQAGPSSPRLISEAERERRPPEFEWVRKSKKPRKKQSDLLAYLAGGK